MVIAIVLVLLVLGTVLFHIFNPWWFTPIASNWQMIDGTVNLTVWVTGLVFIAINLFVALAVWRFRHGRSHGAAYEPENKKLEAWLTGITTVGIVALLAPGLIVWGQFVAVPDDALEVEIVGQQWTWSYRFPGPDGEFGTSDAQFFSADNPFGLDLSDPKGQDDILVPGNELHLPVDRPVKVLARSKDVLHNFAVPQFRVKMDMMPGMVTHFWFTPTKTGGYDVLCMELCGIGHYLMRGRVVVDSQPAFDEWLGARQSVAETVARQQVEASEGQSLYAPCAGCHGPEGQGMETMASPQIAGLDRHYIARQLRHFRDGLRGASADDAKGQQMAAMVNVLPDDSAIDKVAAFVAGLPVRQQANPTNSLPGNAARGRELFRNCAACHGEHGLGIWSMGAPRLAGLQSDYLARQYRHFRDGIRGTSPDDQHGRQMAAIAPILGSERALDDVIAYISTLPVSPPPADKRTARAEGESWNR